MRLAIDSTPSYPWKEPEIATLRRAWRSLLSRFPLTQNVHPPNRLPIRAATTACFGTLSVDASCLNY
jgi:hypothetical protein